MTEFQQLLEEYAQLAVYIDGKEEELAGIKKARDNAKAAVLAMMSSIGITSGKSTDGHQVVLVNTVSARVADADAFFTFVFEEGGDGFLQKRVNNDAVKAYVDEHDGVCPPGITMDTVNSLRFTKAKK
jgi:hypothetical protein